MTSRRIFQLAALSTLTAFAPVHAKAASPKKIEVAFVLDTTGSMARLIDGAKKKIWSMANTIVDINPNAEIKMALVGYRDREDDYVVKVHAMTDDLQGMYGDLLRFEADGGGDTPEAVNEALDAALRDVAWSKSDDVRRIIFLVGDAPPHMDYRNGPKYQTVVANAREAGIVVNTVQAGADPETTEFWKDIAKLGGGQYYAIPQDGGQIEQIASPYDDEIIQLQGRIDDTVILYGSSAKQSETRTKLDTRKAAPSTTQVENSKYYSKKMASKEVVTGGGELLDDIRNNRRKVEDVKPDELPAELKGKSKDELARLVAERTAAREKLEAEMAALVKKRDEFVAAERARKPDEKDSFDRQVSEAFSREF